jgi:hypothetical protein
MDFLRYDGKSDLLIFINRCKSYFHQQRIMEEEKVWMASYNLEEGVQMWYIKVQTDEGTPSGAGSRNSTTCAMALPSVLLPSSSWGRVGRLPPHEHHRGVSGLLRGAPSPHWSPGRGAKGAALHGRPPTTTQPQRPGPQSAIPGRGHEPGTPIGAAGAVHAGTSKGRSPGFASGPRAALGATHAPGRQGGRGGCCRGRAATSQAPVPH